MSFIRRWLQMADGSVDETTGALRVSVPESAPDYVVSDGVPNVTITASAVIPTAFSKTLPAGLLRIAIIPRPGAATVYYNFGAAATANTFAVPAIGLSIPVTKAVADLMQVYAAGGGVVCDLLICTAR